MHTLRSATRDWSRRRFIGAVGAGAFAAVGCGAADDLENVIPTITEPEDKGSTPGGVGEIDPGSPPVTPTTPVDPETPPAPPALSDYKELLLSRVTYGATAMDRALYDELGHDGYVEYQLAWDDIDDPGMDERLVDLDLLNEPPQNLVYASVYEVTRQLQVNALARAVHSRRQLYERMCEFWWDHFYVYAQGDDSTKQMIENDRDNIRPHALGNFGELLAAVVRGPALLTYLTNKASRAGGMNENFARELLELHTVSATADFTQRDVVDLARVLTGWNSYLTGFMWNIGYHDQGAKQVMDLSLPYNGGINDVFATLDYLARHPATAEFIATKLVRRFISEDVPAAVVESVKQAFLSSDGDIKSVLRVLLSQESLAHATPKLKRPFHLIASVLRQSGAEADPSTDLIAPLKLMGHAPYEWQDPDGYPDVSVHWAGGMITRWRTLVDLVNGVMPAYAIPDSVMETQKPNARVAEKITAWNARFFSGKLTDAEKGFLTTFASSFPHQRELFAMMLSLPSFQLH